MLNVIKKHQDLILEIVAILLVILFAVSITPKTLQNDTYYTISIGKLIMQNGIDMQEHFTWHQGLPYTYPHWLYDCFIYLIYAIGSFAGIYISTCVLSVILGITIYKVNSKLSKNNIVSLIITIGSLYLLKGYITARAQLVTFILFMLTLYNIERFIETRKIKNAIILIIIPILIANLHAAVWPFTFVLYLPYIAEYLICIVSDFIIYKKFKIWRLKKKNAPESKEQLEQLEGQVERVKKKRKENLENPYKIKMCKNNNVKWLIVIMLIVMFTGLLTPIGNTPYTYTYLTMKGNTMDSISEHQPLTLIDNIPVMCTIVIFLSILIFTKVKIRLSDLFMLVGLTYLMFSTRRQTSMFALICSLILSRLIVQLIDIYGLDFLKSEIKKIVVYVVILVSIIYLSIDFMHKKENNAYINKSKYPVEASEWILNNLDVDKIKLYNDYNYGSYLLFKGIPVFIDSRADVYDPQFNGGQDIFGDFMSTSNLNKYYGQTFEKYGITHLITTSGSKVARMIRNADLDKYKLIYPLTQEEKNKDKNFVIYEILEY